MSKLQIFCLQPFKGNIQLFIKGKINVQEQYRLLLSRRVYMKLRPLWCRHVQVHHRHLYCTVDKSWSSTSSYIVYCRYSRSRYSTESPCRSSSGPCSVDTFRSSKRSGCLDTSGCSSGRCGVVKSRCSICLCNVDTSRCSAAPFNVDFQEQQRLLLSRQGQIQLRSL